MIKLTYVAFFIAGLLAFMTQARAQAQAVKAKSVMAINCFSVRSEGCDYSGLAKTYEVITANGEQSLVISGEKNMKCVIPESLAKKMKVPFALLVDMTSTRRIDLKCTYASLQDANPSSFSFRAFLE